MLFFLAFGWIKWWLPFISSSLTTPHINNKGVTYPTSIVWMQGTSKSNGLSSFSLFGCLLILGYTSYHSQTEPNHISAWWWLEHDFSDFPIYWEWNNHPNWLIFFRGVGPNHQPDICWLYNVIYPMISRFNPIKIDEIPMVHGQLLHFFDKLAQNWPRLARLVEGRGHVLALEHIEELVQLAERNVAKHHQELVPRSSWS